MAKPVRPHSAVLSGILPGWPGGRAESDERGSVTMFVVVIMIALLAAAGLVIDGGSALAAKRRALSVAEQSARIGADQLDQGALRSGVIAVDAGAAQRAAEGYLAQHDARGSVRINDGTVSVTVTEQAPTVMLSLVGIGALSVSATAQSVSIDEDTQPGNPGQGRNP